MSHSITAPSNRRLELYVSAVVLAALGVLTLSFHLDPNIVAPGSRAAFAVFAVLLIAGELKPIKWLRLDDGGEVTMSWAFGLALLFLGSTTAAAACFALASVVGDLAHQKPLRRILFNASQLVLAMSLAGGLIALLGQRGVLASGDALDPLWLLVIVASSVGAFLVNGALTCVALALHEGTSVVQMLRRGMLPNLSTDGALLALAPCFVVIAQRSLLLLPLVLVTATFVYRSARAALMSQHAARHDPLTELLNRRAFGELLRSCLEDEHRSGPLAVAVIDLNGFKAVNDRLGHHVGDLVLQEVGQRLVAARRPGLIAARLGGDEFAVLLTNVTTADDAVAVAWELHELVSRDSVSNGYPLGVGGSIGVALAPEHGRDAATLMRRADVAMYKAKRAGTGVELYTKEAEQREVGRLGLLDELPGAIRDGQLVVHYQPQIELASGDLVAIEALVRWQHPRLGLVPPGEFMPAAEQTHLMDGLTAYVLERALATAARLRDMGHPLRVAVNASAQNLANLRFPDLVVAQLQYSGVDPSSLELELTENTVLAEPERARLVLEQLRAAGIRLALDDFGTGYSSISSLRDLPIDVIKIDRSFVRDLATDLDDQRIVRSLIDLAHGLRVEVASEGVEDPEALDLLAQYGSDSAQGYLLARPMSEDELVRFVVDRNLSVGFKEAS